MENNQYKKINLVKNINSVKNNNKIIEKLFKIIIYDTIDSIINLISHDKNVNEKEKINDNFENKKNNKIINKIFNLSENEFYTISKTIYNSINFFNSIKKIYNLDNLGKLNIYSDLYQLFELENNSSQNTIKISFEAYFDSIKNQYKNSKPTPNINHNIPNIVFMPINNNEFNNDTNILKIKNFLGYFILLNPDTKKIYDKCYWIYKIKNLSLNSLSNNFLYNNLLFNDIKKKEIGFLSVYKDICTYTDFSFGYDYNSDDFIKTIKYIFSNSGKKSNKLSRYNNKLNSNDYKKSFENEFDNYFDNDYISFIPDKKLDEFLDLYKLFELNIDMSDKEIEQKYYLEEEKINLLNDIEKYVGYNILLNNKTRKIYDNYYLDYYIENWDKILIDFSNDFLTDNLNSRTILDQINFVYSNLFNSDITISDEKLNSEKITNLIDKYNKDCEKFIIKDEKTPEELEQHLKQNMINGIYNKNSDPYELNKELENCINGRNKFVNSIASGDCLYTDINKIINFYKEDKILTNVLIDYNRYKVNLKCVEQPKPINSFNTSPKSLDSSIQNLVVDDSQISNIKLENFDIEDFNLWRIKNYKIKEKISELDINNYLSNRVNHNNEIKNMYKNNLDLIEYFFN
jgi:hypothetical protein